MQQAIRVGVRLAVRADLTWVSVASDDAAQHRAALDERLQQLR
ncbi:MAG TPA: hypothetical protein VG963_20680 [Polyangiaceae bacterium]|nr:hypothetical protein [Polyangiaceae bacterium]